MSVEASSTKFPRGPIPGLTAEPRLLKLLFLGVAAAVVASLSAGLSGSWASTQDHLALLLLWILVAAVADLMPVRLWESVSLSMSLPVTLAAGMVLAPVEAASVAFVAAFDRREFRGEVSVARGLYNRSQVALSVALASTTFHTLDGDVLDWPRVVPVSLVALAVDWLVNTFLVLAPIAYMTRLPARDIMHRVSGRSPFHHLAGYVSLGLLAGLLGAVLVVGRRVGSRCLPRSTWTCPTGVPARQGS
jgi:hypothetical protein